MDEITRTGRMARNIGMFWRLITYAMLLICLGNAVVYDRLSLASPRGAVVVGVTGIFVAWLEVCYRDPQWRQSTPGSTWRFALRWLVSFALLLALTLLAPAFVWMMWVALGMTLGARMPAAAFMMIGPMLVLLHAMGVWPAPFSPQKWLDFASAVLMFAIYVAIVYTPFVLLKQRIDRERLFTELQGAHAELREAHAQLAVAAERERELAVMHERGQLARDLHDSLGHAIALATMQLEAAQRLRAGDAGRADEAICRAQGVLREAMRDLRSTLTALRDPAAARVSLAEGLEQLARAAAERADLALTCDICHSTAGWPPTVQAALLRVGAEAIINCERHARARSLAVATLTEGDTAVMRVIDDGVGISPLPANEEGMTSPGGHFGLAGMRERILVLGGAVAITPVAGGGTRLEARVPLRGAVTTSER